MCTQFDIGMPTLFKGSWSNTQAEGDITQPVTYHSGCVKCTANKIFHEI